MNKAGSDGDLLRQIPQVDRLLTSDEFQALIRSHSRPLVTREVRSELDRMRRRAGSGSLESTELEPTSIRRRVENGLARRAVPFYRRVINATGVVLHTGLGRAALSEKAVEALARLASHPVRVEIDLETGNRGGRDEGCAALLRELAGCEAATLVNNNAGATLLILAALARGKKVLLSRGEMVEIGGSFRVPEIMAEGGARLAGVGTTNRTHLRDYLQALDDDTAMILKVHTSNYRVEGFTGEVEIEELVRISREAGVAVVHDLGSGCMIDLEARGHRGEPLIRRSVEAGADLVCFSGDKLLGGPQSGIILGRSEAVERCRKHPLYRALRPGRLTYIALETTLRSYLRGEEAAVAEIPALRWLLAEPESLKRRARRLARRLGAIEGVRCEVARHASLAGSGSLPARDIETWAVEARSEGLASEEIAARLRQGEPAILVRVREDRVLLDLRTIEDEEMPWIEERMREIAGAG